VAIQSHRYTGLPRFARNDEELIRDNRSRAGQADLVEMSKRIIAAASADYPHAQRCPTPNFQNMFQP
jgi:hypothetical protein